MRKSASSLHVKWTITIAALLVALSALLYWLHYLLFRDVHHIFLYMLGDLAFVPIEVLLVTLIIHQMLSMRQKRLMKEKLNMVIGVFFSDAGTKLIKILLGFSPCPEDLCRKLQLHADWPTKDFAKAQKSLQNLELAVDSKTGDLPGLTQFLTEKKNLLLGLLQNPNILEHEEFTELLWAVAHLAEELSYRDDLKELPDSDYQHLSADIKRAYDLIVREWLGYMLHLHEAYPYLFSLSARVNPFRSDASAVVK